MTFSVAPPRSPSGERPSVPTMHVCLRSNRCHPADADIPLRPLCSAAPLPPRPTSESLPQKLIKMKAGCCTHLIHIDKIGYKCTCKAGLFDVLAPLSRPEPLSCPSCKHPASDHEITPDIDVTPPDEKPQSARDNRLQGPSERLSIAEGTVLFIPPPEQ